MGISFTSHDAKLKHLNVRKEGDEMEPETVIDLKIECETGGAAVIPLLGAEELPQLWRDNEDKDALYPGLDSAKSWAVFRDHEFRFAGLHFKNAKAHKFSFKPIAGGLVELIFSVTINSPTEREVNLLVELLHDTSFCEMIAPPDLFDKKDEAA